MICLYYKKYSACFEPNEVHVLCADSITSTETVFKTIREKTCHKTIVTNNQFPTTSSLHLHCKRIATVLLLNATSTQAEIEVSDYVTMGWKKIILDGKTLLCPQWDTEESYKNQNVLRKSFLKKCNCKTSRCETKRCCCRSSGTTCSNICTCNDCQNREKIPDNPTEDQEKENEEVETEEEDVSDEEECDYRQENISCDEEDENYIEETNFIQNNDEDENDFVA